MSEDLPIWAGKHCKSKEAIPTDPNEYIFFLSKDEVPYGCLSNAYQEPNDGHYDTNSKWWHHSPPKKFWCINQELHYEKAWLFGDRITAKKILDEKDDASKIKGLGREVQGYQDDIWCEKRYDICCKALLGKFTQHEELKQLLLGTGSKMLIEAATDKTWGIGCIEFGIDGAKNKETGEWNIKPEDWKGSNLLGRCLMDVREEIIYSTS